MIEDLIDELLLPGEEYWLQTRQVVPDQNLAGDAVGSLVRKWVNVKKLRGVIQKDSRDPQSLRGQEELAEYYGFFIPNFEIEDNELGEYRIINTVPMKKHTSFTRYFRIETIDRNLVLDNERSHYEITAQLQKEDDPNAFVG
jgi:hypothetical protein